MARIFEPFFTTRREKGGSGLGLSTVHGIVRQSEGYLTVASKPGEGTVMRVWLPRWDGAAEMAIPELPRTAGQLSLPLASVTAPGGRTVLLVEDEAPVRRLAERALATAGWSVVATADAEAALAALDVPHPPRPDVLVTDLAMPGMDGISLIAAARARLDRPDLPAIVASGYADVASRAELEGSGIVFMPKPYTPRELAARLATLV